MIVFEKVLRFFGACEVAVLKPNGRHLVEPKLESLAYLRHENAQGSHILVRPAREVEGFFMLIDDIDQARIEKDHMIGGKWKPGRMCVETSPGNFQVWLHSRRDLGLEEKRHWLRLLGSDPGADPNGRWGRLPGFRNRKEKYLDSHGGYPLAKLIWVDWKDRAEIPRVDLPALKPQPPMTLPRINACMRGDISRADYDKGDDSATDFAYAMALIRRGCTDDEIKHRILSERTDWSKRKTEKKRRSYLDRTVRNARQMISG